MSRIVASRLLTSTIVVLMFTAVRSTFGQVTQPAMLPTTLPSSLIDELEAAKAAVDAAKAALRTAEADCWRRLRANEEYDAAKTALLEKKRLAMEAAKRSKFQASTKADADLDEALAAFHKMEEQWFAEDDALALRAEEYERAAAAEKALRQRIRELPPGMEQERVYRYARLKAKVDLRVTLAEVEAQFGQKANLIYEEYGRAAYFWQFPDDVEFGPGRRVTVYLKADLVRRVTYSDD